MKSTTDDNRLLATEYDNRRHYGAVYTPTRLAEYVAKKTVMYFLGDMPHSKSIETLKLIDPACGDGELLSAAWSQLDRHLKESRIGSKVVKLISPADILYGVDIQDVAAEKTKKRLAPLLPSKRDAFANNINCCNALTPVAGKGALVGWRQLMEKMGANGGFDILIANPPWGAHLKDLEADLARNFVLCRGQYDSADLFIELSLSIVRPGGYCGFIIPDSLFAYERCRLRELLLRQTEIKYLSLIHI